VSLSQGAAAWSESGRLERVGDWELFVRDQDGAGPPLLLLHGFPSSSFDWSGVIDRLPGRRIVAFDFLGFGLSEKPREHRYSLLEAADATSAVAARFNGEPVVIVAHDMGTSVVTELLARDLEGRLDFAIAGVMLLNGSMVIERATLTVSQKLLRSRFGSVAARLSNEPAFRAQLGRIFSRTHPLSASDAADQWSLLAHNGGHRILDRLIAYLRERVQYADRWHGALRDWPGSLELLWALLDPVATKAVLDAIVELRPAAPVTLLPELGHYPQIEDPQAVAGAVAALLERVARGAGTPTANLRP
jgi:pimeloyl-ACP methyl ester carboxylesterase